MKKDIENNIDEEFIDIEKTSKYKKYIIVIILYIIVIVLSIFLVIGIKNQKDTVKDNVEKETSVDKKENIKEESKTNIDKENNSLIEDISSKTEDVNEKIEENNDSFMNILNELE